uniref:Uncharacterized protein n=2 Tax=Fiersviridae TaxID=2842319 RepID=A0A514D2E8_9VIRU|nr:MAG: hypothetical protein H1Bulk29535_000004 [Leviviridae sp.]QDH89148.1 MAG: hypothetical protein H1Rhizo251024_000001 [Leviviridae sp.]
MLAELILAVVLIVCSIFAPASVNQPIDDLTIINGVLCRLSPVIKSDADYSKNSSLLPSCGNLVGRNYPVSSSSPSRGGL